MPAEAKHRIAVRDPEWRWYRSGVVNGEDVPYEWHCREDADGHAEDWNRNFGEARVITANSSGEFVLPGDEPQLTPFPIEFAKQVAAVTAYEKSMQKEEWEAWEREVSDSSQPAAVGEMPKCNEHTYIVCSTCGGEGGWLDDTDGHPHECHDCNGEGICAAPPAQPTTGSEMISAERHRQIEREGWSADHDDEHKCSELALAAICYAAFAASEPIYRRTCYEHAGRMAYSFVDPWPFDAEYDKRDPIDGDEKEQHDISCLVKAGALLAAEIDRRKRSIANGK